MWTKYSSGDKKLIKNKILKNKKGTVTYNYGRSHLKFNVAAIRVTGGHAGATFIQIYTYKTECS